jgi:hypothetical protein
VKYFEYDERKKAYVAHGKRNPRSWLAVLLKNFWIGAAVGAGIAFGLHFLR